jgi:hypothetical protein
MGLLRIQPLQKCRRGCHPGKQFGGGSFGDVPSANFRFEAFDFAQQFGALA